MYYSLMTLKLFSNLFTYFDLLLILFPKHLQIIILLIPIPFQDISNEINIHYTNLLLYKQTLLSLIYYPKFSIKSSNLKSFLNLSIHYNNSQNNCLSYFLLLNLFFSLVILPIKEILVLLPYKIVMLFVLFYYLIYLLNSLIIQK